MPTSHACPPVPMALPCVSLAAVLLASVGLMPSSAQAGSLGLFSGDTYDRPSIYDEPRGNPGSRRGNPRSRRGNEIGFDLRGWGQHTFQAGFKDDTAGDVDISRVGAGVDLYFPAGDRARFGISYDNEFSFYNFEGTQNLGGETNRPLDGDVEFYDARIGANFNAQVSERIGFRAGAGVNFAGESGVDLSDATTLGGFGALSYALDENFTIGGGAAISERLIDDDIVIIPIAFIDWQITDLLALRTRSGFRHIGGEFEFTPVDYMTFTAGAGYERREYRLDDSDLVDTKVAMRDVRVPVSAGVRLNAGPSFDLHLRGGAYVYQEFTFLAEDDDGVFARENEETNRAGFVSLNATLRF